MSRPRARTIPNSPSAASRFAVTAAAAASRWTGPGSVVAAAKAAPLNMAHIVVATQSDLFHRFTAGRGRDQWAAEVTAALGAHTDRPVVLCCCGLRHSGFDPGEKPASRHVGKVKCPGPNQAFQCLFIYEA